MLVIYRAFLLLTVFLFCSSSVSFSQKISFDEETHANAPDYSLETSWAALPFRTDVADIVPKNETWISDSLKDVDVFYVHPTIYQKGKLWNAGLDMKSINRRVDKYPVRLQASVYNASCRVYAPRYRHAVVDVFYNPSDDGDKALNLAYQDVKRAFQYFLKYQNKGRPFIVASHSQGTVHATRLLQELIDTTELKHRMVAAYIIGFTLVDTAFQELKICETAAETNCYITWQSYREGFVPDGFWHIKTQSLNPLTWTLDTTKVILDTHRGTVVLNPKRNLKRKLEVRIKNIEGNVLWIRTKAPLFRYMKDLHLADYGLFYGDIRENVKTRIDSYFKK